MWVDMITIIINMYQFKITMYEAIWYTKNDEDVIHTLQRNLQHIAIKV